MARHEALVTFRELMPAVIEHLEDTVATGTRSYTGEALAKAQGLLTALTSFPFIASLVIVSKVMASIQGLTSLLQERSLDVCRAYQQVDKVRHQLQAYRRTVDEKHDEWWAEVERLAQEMDVTPTMPRRCGRQTQRNNMPAETPKVYCRHTLTIPLLDEVIAQFDKRFGRLQQLAIKGLLLVPNVIAKTPEEEVRTTIREFAGAEKDSLPPGTNMETFEAEVDRWIDISRALLPTPSDQVGPQLPSCDSPAAALKLARKSTCPCIAALLELVCVWPVTTC